MTHKNPTLEEISIRLDKSKNKRKETLNGVPSVIKQLKKDGDTSNQAEFLANICSHFDDIYGSGRQLCLEWMLDFYISIEFEKIYPWLREVWQFLIDNNHNIRNKLDYFNDSEAFYIDKDRLICAFGKSWSNETRYLVMDHKEDYGTFQTHNCYVRKIWKRSRKNCIGRIDRPTLSHYRKINFNLNFNDKAGFTIYGDCRDNGHVLSYKNYFGNKNCDHVMWDINEPLWFFFEVNTLWTQTVGVKDK